MKIWECGRSCSSCSPHAVASVFFDSSRVGGKGGGDIWTANRASIFDGWGAAMNVAEINTAGDDATPDISRDGLAIYWAASGAAGAKDIWYATRPDRTSMWSARLRIPELSSVADESGPSLTPDQLTIFLSRDPTGTDDVYVATRPSIDATWNTPIAVAALNEAGVRDGEPSINGSSTLILWSSGRTGGGDLYLARRDDPSAPWETAIPISELNTASVEGDPWLSPDEHTLYFTRGADIYIATR